LPFEGLTYSWDNTMTTETTTPVAFRDLGLPDAMLSVLADIGYETPSPIQAQTIPLLLEGRDVLGQAQTGTGKNRRLRPAHLGAFGYD
jgi:superfamily II DNA/RNA helicase